MPVEHELRALAKTYSERLSKQIDARVAEMEEDDQSHFLIYRVLGPDFTELSLTGYTGYIEGFEDGLIQIEWDEKTLNNMSKEFIKLCDKENLDHTKISLDISDIDFIDN